MDVKGLLSDGEIRGELVEVDKNNSIAKVKALQMGPDLASKLEFTPTIKKYRAKVSSGTYIRSLANKIGNDLGIGALAFDIHRTEFIKKK